MMRRKGTPLLLIGMLIFTFGCATTKTTKVSTSDFSGMNEKGKEVALTKLASGDGIELSVEVDGVMEVAAHRASVNHSGMVTLPLVGDVKVSGLSLDKARGEISKSYGAYFVNNPVIMISRVEDGSGGEWGFVTVTGRVGNPGRVKVTSAKGMKLTAVIQAAGGFAASAKKNDIQVTRNEPDGRKMRVSVDYEDIGQHGNVDADLDLKGGDIVYVAGRIF